MFFCFCADFATAETKSLADKLVVHLCLDGLRDELAQPNPSEKLNFLNGFRAALYLEPSSSYSTVASLREQNDRMDII